MNKGLTPLQALKRLYGHDDLRCRNEIAYLLYQEELADYYSIVKNALKALEIIINKYVDVELIIMVMTDKSILTKLSAYNHWQEDKNKLTPEEFELLKGILKNYD